jgi:hypothetical protein
MRSRWPSVLLTALTTSFIASGRIRAEDGLVLTATHFGGGLDMRNDWTLHLVGSELTIERPRKKPRVKQLSASAVSVLRQSLNENNFAGLRDRYGCAECTDNPSCRLELKTASSSQVVVLYAYFSSESADTGAQEAAEVRRFVSIWRTIKQLAGLSSMKDLCP